MKAKTIAVDFDGTCVFHDFPDVGESVPFAVESLKELSREYDLILYTMRSGIYLTAAEHWFKDNGINLTSIQYNVNQAHWTASNKCYAHYYIDDAAVGCPTIFNAKVHGRHYVNWMRVISWFKCRSKL